MNQLRINPDPKWVAKLLAVAGKLSAERGGLSDPLADPTEPGWAAMRVETDRDGVLTWGEGTGVVLGWWTDALGRKHVRVRVGRVPQKDATPAEVVHPGQPVFRSDGGWAADELFACGCGAVGTAESIAWTGDLCGPCYDRVQDGGPRPPHTLCEAWAYDGGPLAFTANGAAVVGGAGGKLVYWDTTTGDLHTAPHADRGPLGGVAANAAGTVVLGGFRSGGLVRWDRRDNSITTQTLDHDPGSLRADPTGRYAVLGEGVYRLDWNDPRRPLTELWAGTDWLAECFSPDGQTVFALTARPNAADAEVWAFNSETGNGRRMRESVFGDDKLELRWQISFAFDPPSGLAVGCQQAGPPAAFWGELKGRVPLVGLVEVAGELPEENVDFSTVPPADLCFSPTGGVLAAPRYRSGISFWSDSETVPVFLRPGYGFETNTSAMAFAGQKLVVGVTTSHGVNSVRILPWEPLLAD